MRTTVDVTRTFAQPFTRTASRTKTSAQCKLSRANLDQLSRTNSGHIVYGERSVPDELPHLHVQWLRETHFFIFPLAPRRTCSSWPTLIAFSSLGTHPQSTTGSSKCKRDVLAICAAVHAHGEVRTVPTMFDVKHHAEEETEWAPCNSPLHTAELPEPGTRSAAVFQTAVAQQW